MCIIYIYIYMYTYIDIDKHVHRDRGKDVCAKVHIDSDPVGGGARRSWEGFAAALRAWRGGAVLGCRLADFFATGFRAFMEFEVYGADFPFVAEGRPNQIKDLDGFLGFRMKVCGFVWADVVWVPVYAREL